MVSLPPASHFGSPPRPIPSTAKENRPHLPSLRTFEICGASILLAEINHLTQSSILVGLGGKYSMGVSTGAETEKREFGGICTTVQGGTGQDDLLVWLYVSLTVVFLRSWLEMRHFP